MGDWAVTGDWANNGDWAGVSGSATNRMGGTGAIRKPPR